MWNIERIEGQNIVTYDNLAIDLGYKGVTAIYGRNKDADATRREASNGAGKTLALSPIAELLGFSSLVSDSSGKTAARDLFQRPDAGMSMTFSKDEGKHIFEISKHLSGKSMKVDFVRDGKGLKMPDGRRVRANDYAMEKLRSMLNITEEEYYSYVHIDSRRPSVLQYGSAAERRNYFTRFFNLEDYDAMQSMVKEELARFKEAEVRLSEVADQIVWAESQTDADSDQLTKRRDKLQAQYKEAVARTKELSATMHHVSLVKGSIAAAKQISEELTKLTSNPAKWALGKFNPADLEDIKNGIDLNLKGLKTRKREAQRRVTWDRDYASITEKLAVTKKNLVVFARNIGCTPKELVAATAPKEIKILRDEFDQVRNEYVGIERTLQSFGAGVSNGKKAEQQLAVAQEELGKMRSLETLRDKRDMCVSGLRSAKKMYKFFEEMHKGDCNCPTCGSELTAKFVKGQKAELAEEMEKWQTRLSGIDEDMEMVESLTTVVKDLTLILKEQRKFAKVQERAELLKEDLSERFDAAMLFLKENNTNMYQVCLDHIFAYHDLLGKKTEMEEDKPEDDDTDIDMLEKRISRLDKLTANIESFIHVCKPFNVSYAEVLKVKHIDKVKEDYAAASAVLQSVMEELPGIQAKLDVLTSAKEQLAELVERRKTLKKTLKDKPLYKALLDAYSNKGLKALRMQRLCSIIASQLNLYSPLVFKEEMEFSFDVTETRFDFLVRRGGDDNRVSDVRRLSGAESRAFNAILPLALMPIVPSSKRLNIMILDEPVAHMEDVMKEMFFTQFLPRLTTLVPHVIIIEKEELNLPMPHRTITAVREGGKTELVVQEATL